MLLARSPSQATRKSGLSRTTVGIAPRRLTVNTTDQNYESRYYYVWDANNPLTVTSAFATQPGNARFTLDPELYEIEFTIARNDVQFPGWSVQGLVGGEPRTGFTVVPSVMNINASPTGVSFEMQCPAGQVTEKRTIQGGEIEQLFLDADYDDAESRRYGGWSGAFRYGTDLVKMTNLVIGFNRNYAADEAVRTGIVLPRILKRLMTEQLPSHRQRGFSRVMSRVRRSHGGKTSSVMRPERHWKGDGITTQGLDSAGSLLWKHRVVC